MTDHPVDLAADLTVDLDALVGAARAVTSVVDQVRDHHLDDLDCSPATVGHDQLARTLRSFCDRWHDGIRHLADDGTELAAGLTDTHTLYAQAEATAADAVRAAATGLGATGDEQKAL